MATKQKLEGTINLSELEAELRKTLQFQTLSEPLQKFFVENLSKNKAVEMPTNGFCTQVCLEYRQKLLNLYDGTFGTFKEVNDVPDEVKVSQAALLDSLCFGVDSATMESALYTMNPGIFIPDMKILPDKTLKTIVEKNKVGLTKSFRVDTEYQINQGTYTSMTYKLVNHKTDIDDETDVLLVPVISSIMLSALLRTSMKRGAVLKLTQDIGGMSKVRCVTENEKMLKNYCDTPEVVEGMTADYFPYKAFCYFPVLGAPSNTAMMTKVNLFNLEGVERIESKSEITALGVQKPKDVIESMAQENVLKSHLMYLQYHENGDEFYNILQKLPHREEYMPNLDDISEGQLASYLHSIKRADLKAIIKKLKLEERVEERESLFKKCKQVDLSDPDTLTQILKSSLVRVLIRKKDGTFSNITCTNNPKILEKVYGENYFRYYESFGSRMHRAFNERKSNEDLVELLNKYGFDDIDTRSVVEQGNKAYMEGEYKDIEDAWEDALYEAYGKKKRASSTANSIMVRSIDAYLKGGSAIDYYKNIDPEKIVKAFLLS